MRQPDGLLVDRKDIEALGSSTVTVQYHQRSRSVELTLQGDSWTL